MASDRQQFRDAMERWEQLYLDNCFSVPSEHGTTAVILAIRDNVGDLEEVDEEYGDKFSSEEEAARMHTEADQIVARLRALGRVVDLVKEPDCDEVAALLKDQQISDIVTVTHGDLSSIMLNCNCSPANPASIQDSFTWRDVSEHADHLKRGVWEQRQCGGTSSCPPIPLGAMAVSNVANVWAAVGYFFDPPHLGHSVNRLLQPVTTEDRLTYNDIARFRKLSKDNGGRLLVPPYSPK